MAAFANKVYVCLFTINDNIYRFDIIYIKLIIIDMIYSLTSSSVYKNNANL